MSSAAGSNSVTSGLVLNLDGANIGLTTTVDVLLVAGGGGGGMDMGGGGGGGGVLYTTSSIVHGTSYPVVVGAGGYGAPAPGTTRTDGAGPQTGGHQYTIPATNGSNSTFNGLTAIGGGFGGSSYRGYTPGIAGSNGGSGGGASGYNDNAGTFLGGSGVSGQGNRGGNSTAAYYSGGGGGAGGAGTDSTAQAHGGPGIQYATMSPYYFGGGGGGAAYSLATGGNGGTGGGGGGAVGQNGVVGGIGGLGGQGGLNSGVSGTRGPNNAWANVPGGNGGTNTGGGGGGGSHYNATNKGGEGGSGIVIIRYLGRQRATGGVVSSLNGYTIHKFLTNGTFSALQWLDKSGTGNTGILVNGPTYSSANGGGILFDNTNDYVSEYSIPDSFWNANSWTASAWVKFTTVSKGLDNAVFGHGATAGSGGLHLGERNSAAYFGFYGNDTGGTISLSANTWYNIAWVFNYSTKLKQIYVNGAFDTSGGTVGYGGTGTNTEIGRYPWSPSYLMSGNVAAILLYNRALSAAEVQQNFNASRARFLI